MNARKNQSAFPWWEGEPRQGFYSRIAAFRPLFALTLLAGAAVFVFEVPIPGFAENAPGDPATGSSTAPTPSAGSDASAQQNTLIPPVSLLGSLFGEDSIDPFFLVPDTAIAPPAGGGYEAPAEEPQRSIWNYLVAASDIGIAANASRLGLALATAERGEVAALNTLIAEYEHGLLAYAALTPPEELRAEHADSLAVLERYIAHLRASRDRADGTVEQTWSGPERDAIAQEAGRVTERIRAIVDNFGVHLPSDVLP